MTDIFDNKVLCKKCDKAMQKSELVKNGFRIRTLVCDECNEKLLHPVDEAEYNRFVNLKNKEYRVKMRIVGNSYAVSIPKEIVSFIQHQERMIDDMVRLCFEDAGRLSLSFDNLLKRRSLK